MTAQNSHAAAPIDSATTNQKLFFKHLEACRRSLIRFLPQIDAVIARSLEEEGFDQCGAYFSSVGKSLVQSRKKIVNTAASLSHCRARALDQKISPGVLFSPSAIQSSQDRRKYSSLIEPTGTALDSRVGKGSPPKLRKRPSKDHHKKSGTSTTPVRNSPAVTSKTAAGESFVPAADRESEGGK